MQKLIRNEKLLLFAAVSSAISALLSIAGIIFFIWKLLYVPMAICILIAAHGFYGCPFYFIAYANAKKCEIVLSEIQKGEQELELIAECAGITVPFVEKLIALSIMRGYIGEENITNINKLDNGYH